MRRPYRTDAQIERAKRINTLQDREYRKSAAKKRNDMMQNHLDTEDGFVNLMFDIYTSIIDQ